MRNSPKNIQQEFGCGFVIYLIHTFSPGMMSGLDVEYGEGDPTFDVVVSGTLEKVPTRLCTKFC